MDDFKSERSFDSQATGVIDLLDSFLDMIPNDVCTTGPWETSGHLVQELSVFTVHTHLDPDCDYDRCKHEEPKGQKIWIIGHAGNMDLAHITLYGAENTVKVPCQILLATYVLSV